MSLTLEDIIGRRVKVINKDHPWYGAIASVKGFTEGIGLLMSVESDDPWENNIEFYLTSTNDYQVIHEGVRP